MENIDIWRWVGYSLTFAGVIIAAISDQKKISGEREDGEIAKKERNEEKRKSELLLEKTTSIELTLEPFSKLAMERYPGESQASALQKLNADFQQLSSVVSKEKNTMKSFEARMKIKYTGKWKTPMSFGVYSNGTSKTYLKFIDTSGKHEDIDFGILMAVNKSIDDINGEFDNILTVSSGSNPLGNQIDFLSNYNQIKGWILLSSQPITTEDSKVTFKEITISFIINGSVRGKYQSPHPFVIDTQKGPFMPAPKSDGLITQPMFILDMNVLDMLK